MKTIALYINTLFICLIVAVGVRAEAKEPETQKASVGQVKISDIQTEHTSDNFYIRFNLDLSGLKLKSEKQAAVTPVLTNGDQSVTLPGAIVAGHNRYLRHRRAGAVPKGYTLFQSGNAPASFPVDVRLPFEDWMLSATLAIRDTVSGCNCKPSSSAEYLAAAVDMGMQNIANSMEMVFAPEYVYITPKAEVEKVRQAEGHAYIDFPVNKTAIIVDYRNNLKELSNITDTISLIKNDPDYTITSISLKGYASPEGSYANNDRLASGRTLALKEYIRSIYDFPPSVMHTSWEAEDWGGLIDWLNKSSIANRDALLAIATSEAYDGNPDGRDQALKTRYPAQYRILLTDVYPALRHTDYTVAYTIRTFTTLEELRAVWQSDPRKMSLNELYKLAVSYPAGSPEFIEVFETAVALYPESPEANLNAAIPALQAGDLARAESYLIKAGDSPEALYARGVLEAGKENLHEALTLIRKAEKAGIIEAVDAAAKLEQMIDFESKKKPK